MKNTIHKIGAPILALLVLLSTITWSVEKHLCMGRVMDIAFFHNAERCGVEEAMRSMHDRIEGKHCCDDESFTIEGQDNLKLSWNELELDSQTFLFTFTSTYLHSVSFLFDPEVPGEMYPPPLLVQDLTILHEVFLI